MSATDTHILRVTLRPKVYREIEIPRDRSLHDLALAILHAFDFDCDHAFGFFSKLTGDFYRSPESYTVFADTPEGDEFGGKSVERTKIAVAFPEVGKKMLFLFDYGDEWIFKVDYKRSGTKVPKARYPKTVATVGEAPPQYPNMEDEED